MHPSEACRICGGTGLFLSLFEKDSKYPEDIEACLAVKVSPKDGLPQIICHKCVGFLSWCAKFVSKVGNAKKGHKDSSNCCYCHTSDCPLFPLPKESAEKLHDFFSLSVQKKGLKICHHCQFSLDCISDLREKANTSRKLSRRGQHLQVEVSSKNQTVEELLSSLKNREVEVDLDSNANKSLKASRRSALSKNSKDAVIIKQENGASDSDSGEENNVRKKKSGDKKSKEKHREKSVKKEPENKKTDDTGDYNGLDNNETRIGIKRKRSAPNETSDSVDDSPRSKRLSKKVKKEDEADSEGKRNGFKEDSKSKSKKSKGAETESPSRLSLRKRQRDEESGEDSDDSICLSKFAKSSKSSEKKSRRQESKVDIETKNVETTPRRTQGRRRSVGSDDNVSDTEEVSSRKGRGKELVHNKGDKSKEQDHSSRRRKSSVALPEKTLSRPRRDSVDVEATPTKKSRSEKVETPRSRQTYTCEVCNENFKSVWRGKHHELEHDSRYNKFELRLDKVDPEMASKRRGSKADENDSDDDLWSEDYLAKTKKVQNVPVRTVVDFDSLFGGDTQNPVAEQVEVTTEIEPVKSNEDSDGRISSSPNSDTEEKESESLDTGNDVGKSDETENEKADLVGERSQDEEGTKTSQDEEGTKTSQVEEGAKTLQDEEGTKSSQDEGEEKCLPEEVEKSSPEEAEKTSQDEEEEKSLPVEEESSLLKDEVKSSQEVKEVAAETGESTNEDVQTEADGTDNTGGEDLEANITPLEKGEDDVDDSSEKKSNNDSLEKESATNGSSENGSADHIEKSN